MKKLIALSCFAALLLAGCGKPQQGSSSEGTAATTEPVSTAATAAEMITEKAETTTAAADTTAATTEAEAETTTHEANVSTGGLMDMYPAIYQSFIRGKFDETVSEHDSMASIEYTFRDLDADGIPELLLKYGTCEADFQIHVYRLDSEGEVKDLGLFGGGHTSFAYDENTGNFVIVWGHMGACSIEYYEWKNGTL